MRKTIPGPCFWGARNWGQTQLFLFFSFFPKSEKPSKRRNHEVFPEPRDVYWGKRSAFVPFYHLGSKFIVTSNSLAIPQKWWLDAVEAINGPNRASDLYENPRLRMIWAIDWYPKILVYGDLNILNQPKFGIQFCMLYFRICYPKKMLVKDVHVRISLGDFDPAATSPWCCR